MAQYEFFLASSLEKVFPAQKPAQLPPASTLSAWPGSRTAIQLVYTCQQLQPGESRRVYDLTVSGLPYPVSLRQVELLPSEYPCFENVDADYLSKAPGLFPDLLRPIAQPVRLQPLPRQYRSIWLSWDLPAEAQAGAYEITLKLQGVAELTLPNGQVLSDPAAPGDQRELRFTLNIGHTALPPQSLIHTEWFHADGLAAYYQVEPFSEAHWQILANFIQAAGREHGINMLLTPVFTPPLDTAIGHCRMTIQLVDIRLEHGTYHFNFDKLARWTALCQANGISYLEIAHLFTQWGAAATPHIVAEINGVIQPIFGWSVPADSPAYRQFLAAFLPALQIELTRLGYDRQHVYYHISDEPSQRHLDSYQRARAQVADLLAGCPIMDALSDLDFYRRGLVSLPVPANDHIQAFADANVPDLWVYYCCSQSNLVPNRFFAMPSYRNRIMGVLMYLYNIKGFLHWGYNFYYSQYSLKAINPFQVTDAGHAFPSGDAFLVYPGPKGQALSSVRAEVQDEALLDLRALQYLEQLQGRPAVLRLITQTAGMAQLSFTEYPRDPDFLLRLRELVARAIEQSLS
ncbi:MAG: DUF4091 domain-containing protein [Oscillospiraceae bacterium]|nr:DUF4091 domain-containing protein [Oscillospiraceae bacterium]MDD4368787.1 DUF4091 domain-containing protein [Oscillospiraceae bacterium]